MTASGKSKEGGFSRRGFITGLAAGAAGAWALTSLPERCFHDKDRPPWISEFFVDNFWFESANLYKQPPNPPLKARAKADIAIVGGGFTGLAAAFHLAARFPEKKILLLESAYCGYGASGRNGGMAIPFHPVVYSMAEKQGPEAARKFQELNSQGFGLIKDFIEKYGANCDLEETGIQLSVEGR